MRRFALIAGIVIAVGALGWLVATRLGGDQGGGVRRGERGPAPVEVAPIERGAIELRRTFAGSLEASARFVVAAHVAGRVQKLAVDLADEVSRGQVVAELDDDDEVQGINEAAAELAVARATVADADSAFQIAEKELARLTALRERGVVSESQLDNARSQHLVAETAVKVARARLTRAQAALERAKIRSGYTRVVATWSGDDDRRVVAERHVDEGDMVAAGAPLYTVVALDPVEAVVHVTEREYTRLEPGRPATITTDAHPGAEFTGVLRRIAPVFRESSRQARMELDVPNPDGRLKPGMFIRAEVVLARVEDATVVPVSSLTTRDGKSGVFVVDEAGARVSWHPVEVGIQEGERVQVSGEGLQGRVVILGQQFIDDGSAVTIPDVASPSSAARLGPATKRRKGKGEVGGSASGETGGNARGETGGNARGEIGGNASGETKGNDRGQ